MKNTVMMASLGLAIIAGGAIASGNMSERGDHRSHHSFEELDANGDGKLMKEEMAAHMQSRFEGADANGDGALSKEELLARVKEHQAKRAEKYVSHMIERHDENDDGLLTMDEMKSKRHGKMFAKMDKDQDGAISKEEFESMRDRHRGHKHGKHGAGKDAPEPTE